MTEGKTVTATEDVIAPEIGIENVTGVNAREVGTTSTGAVCLRAYTDMTGTPPQRMSESLSYILKQIRHPSAVHLLKIRLGPHSFFACPVLE